MVEKCQVIGYVRGDKYGYSSRYKLKINVCAEIKKSDDCNPRLSFFGEIWTPRKVDIITAGQIDYEIWQLVKQGKIIYAKGWNKKDVIKLLKIWDLWHLNDMKGVPDEDKFEYIKTYAVILSNHRAMIGWELDWSEVHEIMRRKFPYYGERWWCWKVPRWVVEWVKSKFGF